MSELVVARDVAASAETVWRILTDLDRAAETISAITELERLDGGTGFGVGTRWRETRIMFGRTATEELEVTRLEPGNSYVVEAESHGARYRSEMTVEPIEEAACRLTMSLGAEAQGTISKILASTIGRLFERSTRKAFKGIWPTSRPQPKGQPETARPDQRSRRMSTSARRARPRWLNSCFSATDISANVRPSPSAGTNTESYPNPFFPRADSAM